MLSKSKIHPPISDLRFTRGVPEIREELLLRSCSSTRCYIRNSTLMRLSFCGCTSGPREGDNPIPSLSSAASRRLLQSQERLSVTCLLRLSYVLIGHSRASPILATLGRRPCSLCYDHRHGCLSASNNSIVMSSSVDLCPKILCKSLWEDEALSSAQTWGRQ